MTDNEAKKYAVETARLLDQKKAEDVKVYDLQGKSSLCDYVIVATALASSHLDAVEQEVSTELKKVNLYKINRDGGDTGTWRVSDYGGFMLHILTKSSREYYELDNLFSFGKELGWQEPVAKKAPAKETAVKKPAAKKTTAKKPAVKKTAVKKTAVKKVAVKKAPAKAAAKKTAVKKVAVKATAKKATVKKTAAKKPVAKKVSAKKPALKKAAVKTAKKTTKKTAKK